MPIVKQTISLADNITERGQVHVKTITRWVEDGNLQSESVHRKVLSPGDSLTGEDSRVAAVATALWTPEVIAAWQAGGETPTVENKRAATWYAIRAKRDALSAHGGYKVTVDGVEKWFHSDPKSQIQQLGLKEAGAGIPAGLKWKTMDGSFVTMTPTLAVQIFGSAMAQDAAIFQAAETHRAAMEAAADPLAYDYTRGWPAVFPGVA
jgi:hypothetical protein